MSTEAEHVLPASEAFPLAVLGQVRMPALDEGLPAKVLDAVLAAEEAESGLPPEVLALMEEREAARSTEDRARADAPRERLAGLGYTIEDTPQGPRWRRG